MIEYDEHLIFDIGFHDGSDSRYYLDKGFRVVAVEADANAVSAGQHTFQREIESGALTIVNKGIWHEAGKRIPFYLRDGGGWNSVFQSAAERDGQSSVIVEIETATIPALFDIYGVPRYLKCDIEGADEIVVEQVGSDGRLPPFLSIESFDPTDIDELQIAGYDRFQLVNQGHLKRYRAPRPAREGNFSPNDFDGANSGLFGRDLPLNRWIDRRTCVSRLSRWKEMKLNYGAKARLLKHLGRLTHRDWLDCSGWMDIHATNAALLRP